MLLQEKMIQSVRAKAEADPRVAGLLMYGSFTQRAGDQYSDIEFYVFVEDDAFADMDSVAWIREIHPAYTVFFNEFGTQVAIYTNLIRGEFHFMPLSGLSEVEGFAAAGYFPDVDSMLLYDPQGLLEKATANLRGLKPPFGKAEAEDIVNNLLNYLLYGSNTVLRGEYARSLEVLFFAQRLYLQGIRLLEDEAQHFINPNKNLENEISPEAYKTYVTCIAALEEEEIFRAYGNLIRESRVMAAGLAARYDFDGQSELFYRVHDYFQNGGAQGEE